MIEFITFCLVYVNFTIVFEFVTEIGHVDDADIERLLDPVPRGDFKPISLPSGEANTLLSTLKQQALVSIHAIQLLFSERENNIL